MLTSQNVDISLAGMCNRIDIREVIAVALS